MDYPMNDAVQSVVKAQSAYLESASRIGAAAMSHGGRLAGYQLAVANKWADAAGRQIKLAAEIGAPLEMLTRSTELATELGQELAILTREGLELQAEIGDAMAITVREELVRLLAAAKGISSS